MENFSKTGLRYENIIFGLQSFLVWADKPSDPDPKNQEKVGAYNEIKSVGERKQTIVSWSNVLKRLLSEIPKIEESE